MDTDKDEQPTPEADPRAKQIREKEEAKMELDESLSPRNNKKIINKRENSSMRQLSYFNNLDSNLEEENENSRDEADL